MVRYRSQVSETSCLKNCVVKVTGSKSKQCSSSGWALIMAHTSCSIRSQLHMKGVSQASVPDTEELLHCNTQNCLFLQTYEAETSPRGAVDNPVSPYTWLSVKHSASWGRLKFEGVDLCAHKLRNCKKLNSQHIMRRWVRVCQEQVVCT